MWPAIDQGPEYGNNCGWSQGVAAELLLRWRPEIDNRIRDLDDATAKHILSVFARARADEAKLETELTTSLRTSLVEAFRGDSTESPGDRPVSDGDLARAALAVAAANPQDRAAILALIDGPRTRAFDAGGSLALIAAALIVLQTRVRFERTPDGKYKLLVEKSAAGSALLKPLVEKLLAWVPDGPFGKK
jgi:hypothetical protein